MTLALLEADKENDDKKACSALSISLEEARSKYARKAVMVMRGGGCSFEAKWLTLRDLGAGAMIVVDSKPGHFPVSMELPYYGQNAYYNDWRTEPNGVGIPVCMTFHEMWDRFASLSNVRVNFKYFRKYRFDDERLPDNDITGPRRRLWLCKYLRSSVENHRWA